VQFHRQPAGGAKPLLSKLAKPAQDNIESFGSGSKVAAKNYSTKRRVV
jgi:hypothetical protein